MEFYCRFQQSMQFALQAVAKLKAKELEHLVIDRENISACHISAWLWLEERGAGLYMFMCCDKMRHAWLGLLLRKRCHAKFSKKQWSADCQDGGIVEGDFVGTFIPVPIPTAEFRRWDRDEKQVLKPCAKGCHIVCPLNIHPLYRVLDVGKRA